MLLQNVFLRFISRPIVIGNYYLPFNLAQLLLQFVLPIMGIILSYILVIWLLKNILKNAKAPKEATDKIFRWIRLALRLLVFISFLIFLTNLFGAQGFEFAGRLLQFINQPLFSAGNTNISLLTLLFLIPVFYLSSLAGQSIQMLFNKSLFSRLANMDEAKKLSVANLVRYITMSMVFFFLLSVIGIDFSAIGAMLAVLGIGVGFGLQDLVANFFAGIVIIFAQQVKERDRIVVDGHEGTVTAIRLLSTTITTLQNEDLIIPNSYITNSVIHNASYWNREIVLINQVEVNYQSDMDKVLEIMIAVGAENPYRKRSEEPMAIMKGFNDSGVLMELRLKISEVTNKLDAHSWNNLELWRSFKAQGIEIPYPQVDLHIIKKALEEKSSNSN
ncbi:MAG: mechanosensitive ion channel [Spirochaetaceae bacterium]|jgi:potassium efflux system protein|nr:mechanosensitive ion channel [Spirochaetaceae bacterium]